MLQALIQVNTEHQRRMRIPTNFFFSLSTHDDCPIDQGAKHLWSDIQLHWYFTVHNIKRRGDESFALRRDTVTTASCAQTAGGSRQIKWSAGRSQSCREVVSHSVKAARTLRCFGVNWQKRGGIDLPPWLSLRCDVSADEWEGSGGGGGGGKSPSVGARSETHVLSALLIVLKR